MPVLKTKHIYWLPPELFRPHQPVPERIQLIFGNSLYRQINIARILLESGK